MSTTVLVSPSHTVAAIQQELDNLQPGDSLVFRPGTYRMSLRVAARGTEAAPVRIAAEVPGSVVITGTDPVSDWTQDGADWATDIDLSCVPASQQHGRLAGRCEQVFIDGEPLCQVLHRDQLCGGRFFYDEETKRLYIRPQCFTGESRGGSKTIDKGAIQGGGSVEVDRSSPEFSWPFLIEEFNPANHLIEVTTRFRVFTLEGEYQQPEDGSRHIILDGIIFRGSGDQPQQAMVHIGGSFHVVENCQFNHGASRGFDMRCHNSVVRNGIARMNGQMGFSGYGTNNLVEDFVLQHNNTKHDTFVCFEQGGCKIVRTENFVLRNVRAIENDGPGLWYDIDNHHALIERCLCQGNTGPGIMYEISTTAVIRNNVCVRNGFMPRKDWTWDKRDNSSGIDEPIYGQGILVQMSRGCKVYNNTCVGNRRVGIDVRHHPYQQAGNAGHSKDLYILENNEVFNNLLVDNGWCNLDVTSVPLNPVKAGEVRDNTHDFNLYHNSTALLQHGGDLTAYARWGKTLGYGVMSLEEWRASRHQDAHSIQWDPSFIGPDHGDFSPEPWSVAVGRGRPVDDLRVDFHGRCRSASPTIGAIEPLRSV